MAIEGRVVPKIFISYSWTNQEHEEWVLNLAERLMTDEDYSLKDNYSENNPGH